MISGIYCIRNIINDKRYIGQTIDFDRRKREHLAMLKAKDDKENKYLINAFHKYGEENFKFEILETVKLTNDINTNKYFLSLYESDWYCEYYPLVYNIRIISQSCLGIKHGPQSAEHIKKLSEIRKGVKQLSLHIQKRSEACKKSIIQIDPNTNEVIKIWPGIIDAMHGTNIHKDNIRSVLTYKTKTAGGYKWRYNDGKVFEFKL